MTKQEIQRQLRLALKKSPYRANIRRVSLFGSHVHGNANAQSDVDLLIEFYRPMSILKIVHMERDFGEALGRKVDLCTPMSLSRYFRSDVLREAEPIFEAVA